MMARRGPSWMEPRVRRGLQMEQRALHRQSQHHDLDPNLVVVGITDQVTDLLLSVHP